MYLAKLIWVGAAYLAGREVVAFLRDESPPVLLPTSDPPPDEAVDPIVDDDPVTTVHVPSATSSSDEEELQESRHTLAFTIAGLAIATFGSLFHPGLRFLSVPLLVVGIVPPAKRAYRASKKAGQLTYAGLEIVQAGAELALGEVFLTAGGWLLYAGGKQVLLTTRREARKDLIASVTDVDQVAWVMCDGAEAMVKVEDIKAGDHVVVRAGDSIPVDGTIMDGVVGVDQRAFTGEAALAELGAGDTVLAATSVISGEATIRADRTGQDTVMARVESLLASATSYEQQLVARVTDATERSVRPTLALAAFGFVTRGPTGIIGGLWTNTLDMAWMSMPYSMLNTIRAAARGGILIKDGRSLDLLAKVDTVVFDKTGTLTSAELEVASVSCRDGLDAKFVLRLAAAVEQSQNHPIADAIVAYAKRDREPLPKPEGRQMEIGYGVRGRAGGHDIVVGSTRLFALDEIELPASVEALQKEAGRRGHSNIHVAIDGCYAGTIALGPLIRSDAQQLINTLRRRGLKMVVLSGDDEAPTRVLANELGIERYVSGALPETKAKFIEEIRAEGAVVCFVGDGVNDSLAMHAANLSVSLAGASAIAIESAQVILREGELGSLEALFRLGEDFAEDQRIIMGSAIAANAINSFGFIFAGFNIPALLGIYALGVGLNIVTAVQPQYRDYTIKDEGAKHTRPIGALGPAQA